MTSNMALIDTNDRWLLKLSSVSPIVSFIRVARAAQSWIFRRIPIYPIALVDQVSGHGPLGVGGPRVGLELAKHCLKPAARRTNGCLFLQRSELSDQEY